MNKNKKSTIERLSEGIWLVKSEGRSKQHILNIGELPKLYPYAQMALDIDDLASFITCHSSLLAQKSMVIKDGSVTYSYGTNSDMAQAILKFLALTPEERKVKLDEMRQEFSRKSANQDYIYHAETGKDVFYIKNKIDEKTIAKDIDDRIAKLRAIKRKLK